MKTKNAFIQLIQYTHPRKSTILWAIICSILNKLCDIVPEILIGIAIDIVVNQHLSIVAQLGIANPFHQLYVVGFITALLWIFESIFEYLYSIAWRSLAQEIQHNVRLKAYDTVQELDMQYFENTTTGGLLNILKDDIAQLELFLSQGPNEIIQLMVNVIVMGSIFLYLSPMLALMTIIPLPFVIGIAYYFQHKLARLYETVRHYSARLATHLTYRLHGITTIKSYTTQQYELALLQKESVLYQSACQSAHRINAQYIPTVRMAIMVGFIMSLIGGGIYALQGIIPLNWYAALVFLTQRFLWPFTTVTTITDLYEQALASSKRILTLLTSRPTITSGTKVLDSNRTQGAITFDNVSFAYASGTKIFNTLSLSILAKTTIAFVGTTGSGKSTLIKLLLRLYDATAGSILIDQHNINDLTLDSLRKTIGLVSQDVYVVEGTIADNIAYGTFEASRDEIMNAAKMAQAHDFIMSLPQGYNTVVQEHGKNLSGGQRQRLAIARALLKKSPILIFDEATSAIDNETEAALNQSMTQLAQDHTIIIIAHRLSTVRNADTIYVLDQGSIIESGNHEQLLDAQGVYAQLWNTQLK